MPKRKYRNVSNRVVAGTEPGQIIRSFPDGVNVRALERAGLVAVVRPAKKKTEGVTDGDTGTEEL